MNKTKISAEQMLAATHQRLLITAVFCCVGWIFFVIGFIGMSGNFLLMLIGSVIAAGPILYRMMQTKSLKGAFSRLDDADYEVITTHTNGTKTSDGGHESRTANFILQIILAFVILIVGCIVTLVYLVWLIISYIILYLVVTPKPAFLLSGFPIIIGGLVVLIGGLIGAGFMQNARTAKLIESHYSPAEVRSMIEETQRNLLATSFSYTVQTRYDWNRGAIDNRDADNSRANVTVTYNNADNTTVIEIKGVSSANYFEQYQKGISNLFPGTFTFRGNQFTGFTKDSGLIWFEIEDYNDPNDADIEAAKAFMPSIFFFGKLSDAEYGHLSGRDASNDQLTLSMGKGEGGSRIALYVTRIGDTYRLRSANVDGLTTTIIYN